MPPAPGPPHPPAGWSRHAPRGLARANAPFTIGCVLIAYEDYREWDACEMARLVRAGEVTAEDLAETATALIDAFPALNAVAAVADPRPGPAGNGPLAGAPFAVKELLAWPELPWTM